MKGFLLTLGFALIGFLALTPVTANQARANAVPVPVTSPFVPISSASIGAPPVSLEVDVLSLQPSWFRRFVHWIWRSACRVYVNIQFEGEDVDEDTYALAYAECNGLRAS